MKPKQKFFIVSLVFLIIILACGLFSALDNQPVAPTDDPVELPTETQPMASNTPRPTDPPQPTDTPEPTIPPPTETPPCLKWDQITIDMVGEVVCVYGIAYSHQGQSRIDFSPEKNSFFLIDTVYYYPNLSEGVCVVAEEEVEVFDHKIPFMTINGNLYKCDPWMME